MADIVRRLQPSSCWHCGSRCQQTSSFTRTSRGTRVRCAVRVAAPPLNGSNSSALATTTVCARSPRRSPTANTTSGNRDAWQRPELARHVIRDLGAGCRETMLLVEGVRCAACVWLIERALGALPGVVSVQVNAAAQRARITWHDATTTLPQILDHLARTGYRAHPLMQQHSTMCVGASHATRSSGCWSRGSARCRP